MPNRRPRTIPSRQPWLSPFRKSGHHDDCRSLYWRSEARLPTGLASRPTCRGTCPPQVLEAQGAKGRSRLAGPYRQVYCIDELTDDMKGTGGQPGADLAYCERGHCQFGEAGWAWKPAWAEDVPTMPRLSPFTPGDQA